MKLVAYSNNEFSGTTFCLVQIFGTLFCSILCLLQVYFMDTQIWYSVFCTIFGGVYGVLHHLGEVSHLFLLFSYRSSTLALVLQWYATDSDIRNVEK